MLKHFIFRRFIIVKMNAKNDSHSTHKENDLIHDAKCCYRVNQKQYIICFYGAGGEWRKRKLP